MIVGGGPAGIVAGLLFARAGMTTLVLETHGDSLRDCRGDTVRPSTLDLFDELGLFERRLDQPHDKVTHVDAVAGVTTASDAAWRARLVIAADRTDEKRRARRRRSPPHSLPPRRRPGSMSRA